MILKLVHGHTTVNFEANTIDAGDGCVRGAV